jgi:hypothetical protein
MHIEIDGILLPVDVRFALDRNIGITVTGAPRERLLAKWLHNTRAKIRVVLLLALISSALAGVSQFWMKNRGEDALAFRLAVGLSVASVACAFLFVLCDKLIWSWFTVPRFHADNAHDFPVHYRVDDTGVELRNQTGGRLVCSWDDFEDFCELGSYLLLMKRQEAGLHAIQNKRKGKRPVLISLFIPRRFFRSEQWDELLSFLNERYDPHRPTLDVLPAPDIPLNSTAIQARSNEITPPGRVKQE